VALLVEEIPIDVLAERLATNRNALYQTLHEVRKRLRAYLSAEGYLGTDRPQEASR
jgi:RNA polymerase sigma-70 factor (ECF subfamily)